MYLIISLKHTAPEDKYLTLWGPNNQGYTYDLEKAGIYKQCDEGYHNDKGNLVITENLGTKLAILTQLGNRRIPNCRAVWDILGVKYPAKLRHLIRCTPYKLNEP